MHVIDKHRDILSLVTLDQAVEAEVGRDTRPAARTGEQFSQCGAAGAFR